MSKQWNPGQLLSTSSAYWQGCTLQAGVRLQIFTHLADSLLDAATVATAVNTDARATCLLLDALCGMNLIRKKDGQYANTDFSSRYLNAHSPEYMGHILLHHHHLLDGWAQLDQAVVTGKAPQKRSYGEAQQRESFLLGMFNLSMMLAPMVAVEIDLTGKKLLLDLGGGPGTYAIHFCLKNPGLKAVIFDRPTTEPFATDTIAQFGLADRVSFSSGDFVIDPIGNHLFDTAWLSHILHSNNYENCQKVIDKVITTLKPGGLILIHDFILNNSKDSPEYPTLFSLNMLLAGNKGRAYSEEEIFTMLETAGAKNIKRLGLQSPNDSAIICATK